MNTEPVTLTDNPFALMMDPAAVLRAVEQSQRTTTRRRRICRPLDKAHGEAGAAVTEHERSLDGDGGAE